MDRHGDPPPPPETESPGSSPCAEWWNREGNFLFPALLLLLCLAIYYPVAGFDFVTFDDTTYVTRNPRVLEGLTWDGVRWAFHTTRGSYWQPLTWLSHMLDVEIFGHRPGGPHVINLLLHAANAILLYLAFSRMTGDPGKSFFAAALYCAHPLRIESVAWVAERKDVLSAFFGFLSLALYRPRPRSRGKALPFPMIACYALSLMAKPTFVTLPAALLLIDYWPLRRFRSFRESLPRLLFEKLPLFALSAASVLTTILLSSRADYLVSQSDLPLGARIENALVSIPGYLLSTLWPSELAFYYPHPGASLPAWKVALSLAFLIAATVAVLRSSRKFPFLPVGWGWFLLTLLPVIGLTQIGGQGSADRFTYLPHAVLFLAAVFGGSEAASRLHVGHRVATGLAVLLVVSSGISSHALVRHWRNSETLYRRALSVTRDNWVAHHNLGALMYREGRTVEAIAHFRETLRIRPRYAQGHASLAQALEDEGRADEALSLFEEAVRLDPSSASSRRMLAGALKRRGRVPEAAFQYKEAARLDPEDTGTLVALGFLLTELGQPAESAGAFEEAILVDPRDGTARLGLGIALARQGRVDEAITRLEEAVRLLPQDPVARVNLGLLLAERGHYGEAVSMLREAERLAGEGSEASLKAREALGRIGRERHGPSER